MTQAIAHHPTFNVSLALTAHHQADTFRRHQRHPTKAKQVYLNTLAVYAVNEYLNCLNLDTDLEASAAWNPLQQVLLDTAALQVADIGPLECRPILPDDTILAWPSETSDETVAIVAVALDESLRSATLLGFVPPATGPVPLEQLQPLEELGPHLLALQPVAANQPAAVVPQTAPVQLSRWWDAIADDIWQMVSDVAAQFAPQPDYAFGFRGSPESTLPDLDEAPMVCRQKQCWLGGTPQGLAVNLLVGIQAVSTQEMNVYVQIKAAEPHLRLPTNLAMAVLDDTGTEAMQAQSLGTEALQMRFSTTPGEQFQLRLTLNDISITETFVA